MTFVNCCALGPQSELEAKKQNWHRMDCLAKHYLNKFDKQAVLAWFAKQDPEWQESRRSRIKQRLNERRW